MPLMELSHWLVEQRTLLFGGVVELLRLPRRGDGGVEGLLWGLLLVGGGADDVG